MIICGSHTHVCPAALMLHAALTVKPSRIRGPAASRARRCNPVAPAAPCAAPSRAGVLVSDGKLKNHRRRCAIFILHYTYRKCDILCFSWFTRTLRGHVACVAAASATISPAPVCPRLENSVYAWPLAKKNKCNLRRNVLSCVRRRTGPCWHPSGAFCGHTRSGGPFWALQR